jgi:Prenyltransferase and squalene oxidase repeat
VRPRGSGVFRVKVREARIMHFVRRTFLGASSVGLALLLVSATLMTAQAPAGAAPASPQIPQFAAAKAAANWLVTQQAADGSIGGSLSTTANAILALAAAHDTAAAQSALSYMETNADAYINSSSTQNTDGPGQLALLILDARAMNVNPTSFGGTNLPARMVATEQTSGVDAGLFGTEAQLNSFTVGGYVQGLVFVALKAVGQTADTAALNWLTGQQCASGGWVLQSQATSTGGCTEDPSSGTGPDTNSTSLALQGLAAQGAVTASIRSSALSFLTSGQDADGGWSYYPNSTAQPQQTDPQSTGLVIQALLAMGLSPTTSTFTSSGHSPVSALLSFVVTSGSDAGAISSPFGSPTTGDVPSTNQVTPVLAGLTYGFGPPNSYWVVTANAAVHPFGAAQTFGSLSTLNKPIVGMAATLNGLGYWLVASDGGIFSFGDAAFHGSRGGQLLNKPIVGMAATPDGGGYWLVASDGGIFSYGDAAFYGSRGGQPLNKPIVGMATTPDGGGYWLVASDGGIFSYGDAVFQGSTGGIKLNQPIVGMAGTRDGGGYWLIASDGGVFNYGDALFSGSAAPLPSTGAAVGGAGSSS